jgi:hypothetical protein
MIFRIWTACLRRKSVKMTTRLLFSPLLLVMTLNHAACGAENSARASASPQATAESHIANAMNVKLKIADRAITATLIDSETTRDFVSLLPLTLTMNDLFGREKFGHLPRAISEGGKQTRTHEVGDVIYWSPGPDVAIFYRHDGQSIPSPGIIVMGKIDSGVDALNVPGSVKVTIERADHQQ